MVVNIVTRVENGFVKYRDTSGGPAVYFADTTQPLYLDHRPTKYVMVHLCRSAQSRTASYVL